MHSQYLSSSGGGRSCGALKKCSYCHDCNLRDEQKKQLSGLSNTNEARYVRGASFPHYLYSLKVRSPWKDQAILSPCIGGDHWGL